MNKIIKKIIYTNLAPEPIGPYSQAILVSNATESTLYVSGQIGLKNGVHVNADIQAETHQVMQNMKFILEEAGMSFADVVKCGIFVKDMNNFVAINLIYGEYFSQNPPARETVEVSRLPKDVNVEISCIAIK